MATPISEEVEMTADRRPTETEVESRTMLTALYRVLEDARRYEEYAEVAQWAYDEELLNRLSFVRRARDLGFSLDQVRDLLGLADQTDRSCEAVDAIARQHLGEVERKIADLTALRDELAEIIERCDHGTVAECRIIGALAPVPAG
jgi:hypothetical protein